MGAFHPFIVDRLGLGIFDFSAKGESDLGGCSGGLGDIPRFPRFDAIGVGDITHFSSPFQRRQSSKFFKILVLRVPPSAGTGLAFFL